MPCGYDAEAVVAGCAMASTASSVRLRRSATFDQGSESAGWATIAATFGIDVWICDPHTPLQPGHIENQNRQIRWSYPRGVELSLATPDHADGVAHLRNGQRRRSLAYQPVTRRHPPCPHRALTTRHPSSV